GDEMHRRFVFESRAIRKLAWRHHKASTDSARVAKSFRPADSFARPRRDRHKSLRRFPRLKNRAPFSRPGLVLQTRGKALVCRESTVRPGPIDRAGIGDP